MIRVFVALDLPDAVRAGLPAVADEGAWRMVPRESLHVTLAFLGSLEESALPVVSGAVAGALRPLGELVVSRVVVLPAKRPRVMAVELRDASGAVGVLQAALASVLSAAGVYEPEHRRWLPHVTIARARRGASVDRSMPLPAVEPLSFVPPSVTVYRSHPGSRYEVLARFELPGS